MDPTSDELAGIIDLFGALSDGELRRALDEVAARTGDSALSEDGVSEAIDEALDSFALLAYDVDGTPGYAVGPTAFPEVPPHAEDLPHILDLPRRSPDSDTLGRLAGDRFAADVDGAIEAGRDDRARDLLDLSYDVEAWAPVDLDDERDRLDALCS